FPCLKSLFVSLALIELQEFLIVCPSVRIVIQLVVRNPQIEIGSRHLWSESLETTERLNGSRILLLEQKDGPQIAVTLNIVRLELKGSQKLLPGWFELPIMQMQRTQGEVKSRVVGGLCNRVDEGNGLLSSTLLLIELRQIQ